MMNNLKKISNVYSTDLKRNIQIRTYNDSSVFKNTYILNNNLKENKKDND